MRNKKNAKNVISSYRRKQKMGPYILGGLAILLAIAGIVLLIIYLTGGGGGITLFKTKTPTPTETPTPTPVTPTATITMTATITETPTVTATMTPSGPFEYVVQEEDNCTTIAEQFEVDVDVLLALNNLDSTCYITPGQTILIPAPARNCQRSHRCRPISLPAPRLNMSFGPVTIFMSWQNNITVPWNGFLMKLTNTAMTTIWIRWRTKMTSMSAMS